METSQTTSFKEEFSGYFQDTDEIISAAWKTHLFIFDTNQLFNFYRYSDSTTTEFRKILETIKDQLWLPHRVAYEFFENRTKVISAEIKGYDDTIKQAIDLSERLKNKYRPPFVSDPTLNQFNEIFEKLIEELTQNKNDLDKKIESDDVKNYLSSLYDKKVGLNFSEEELDKLVIEGEKRYREKIPPGFADAKEKSKHDGTKKDILRLYGDLIIWKQILKIAKDKSKGVILITGDYKDDWWQESRGQTIGPHPDLIKEFQDVTGQTIYLYKADRFLSFASNALNLDVSENAVEEVKEVAIDNAHNPATTQDQENRHFISKLLSGAWPSEDEAVRAPFPDRADYSTAVKKFKRHTIRKQIADIDEELQQKKYLRTKLSGERLVADLNQAKLASLDARQGDAISQIMDLTEKKLKLEELYKRLLED